MADPILRSDPGYHIRQIKRGKFGELSKVREELEEVEDAEEQGVSLMILIELSDMIGAIDGYLAKHFPDTTLSELVAMSAITQRAFRNGHRKSR